MKIIDNNGRLFGKISVIDVVVILVALVMAVALYTKTNHKDITSTSTTNETITYQIQVTGVPTYIADSIHTGDKLFDTDHTSGGTLGEITNIAVTDGTRLTELQDGSLDNLPMEGYCNIMLTVEGSGIISDNHYLLNRIYELGVNSHRNYYTAYTQFTGTVYSIG